MTVSRFKRTRLLDLSHTYLDLDINRSLLIVELIVIVRVHLQIVESEFLLDPFLEGLAFLEGERIGLSDDRNDVDNVGQLFQDHDVNWFETKSSGNELCSQMSMGRSELTHGQMVV